MAGCAPVVVRPLSTSRGAPGARAARRAALDRLADHRLDQHLVAPAGHRTDIDEPAAPHDRDAVGAGAHVGELVGDHHHRPPLLREAAHQAVEPRCLVRREHRRRLVEDDEPGIEVEDLGEFDQLPLADREVADQRPRVDVGGERAELRRHRLVLRRRPPRPRMRPGEEQVLDDAERRQEAELLEHHADAERHRIARRGDARPTLPSIRIVPASGVTKP